MKLKAVGWYCPKCGMFLHQKGEGYSVNGVVQKVTYYNCQCKMSYNEREKLKNGWFKRVYIRVDK